MPALQKKFGIESIVSVDQEIKKNHLKGIVELADIRSKEQIEQLIIRYQITEVYHLAGLLSVGSEKNPDLAWDVNLLGLKTILDLAQKYHLKVFWPSSIAVFGPTTPRDKTPQHTVLEPTTMYGLNKVAGELLCQYYHQRYGVDVRSLRYPGLIGYRAEPGDGTTEYSVNMFYDAILRKKFICNLRDDTRLPMMYIEDAIRGTIQLMEKSSDSLTIRTSYNFSSLSFTPRELFEKIHNSYPDFQIEYQPDQHQQIADTWPNTIDDSIARTDWAWEPKFGLKQMVEEMAEKLEKKLKKE